jgi:hypothetical protein
LGSTDFFFVKTCFSPIKSPNSSRKSIKKIFWESRNQYFILTPFIGSKISNEFYYRWKPNHSKKNQIQLVYFYIFIFLYFLHLFWKKTPKITQWKIFAPIFFQCKIKTLHYTNFFLKTPNFILHSVLCRCSFWKFWVYTGECKCKFKKKIHCTVMPG